MNLLGRESSGEETSNALQTEVRLLTRSNALGKDGSADNGDVHFFKPYLLEGKTCHAWMEGT